jgi:NADPH2:quinone reductase
MRAMQITELTGPATALKLVDLPDPEPSHMFTPGQGVVVGVEAAGVSYPEVLQTRGEYQFKPPLPFVPGSEVAGIVKRASEGASPAPGARVAAFCMLGGFAQTAVAPEHFCFSLPEALDFAQGAGLVLNYHTAYFALKVRGRVKKGETVLVHGAAGGVGTAGLQVAKGLGASTIGIVSSDAKERVAREAGADHVLRANGPWKDEAKEVSGGGVDIVLDPVGGERFTDSLRSLAEGGRAVVVGFTGGSIPEVKVNRLLLNNTEVIGAGWGAYVMSKPDVVREIGAEIGRMIDDGFVRPIVGAVPARACCRGSRADRRAGRGGQGRTGRALGRQSRKPPPMDGFLPQDPAEAGLGARRSSVIEVESSSPSKQGWRRASPK